MYILYFIQHEIYHGVLILYECILSFLTISFMCICTGPVTLEVFALQDKIFTLLYLRFIRIREWNHDFTIIRCPPTETRGRTIATAASARAFCLAYVTSGTSRTDVYSSKRKGIKLEIVKIDDCIFINIT